MVTLQRLLPFNGRDDMFPALEKRPDPVKVLTVRPYFASDQVSVIYRTPSLTTSSFSAFSEFVYCVSFVRRDCLTG